MLTVHSQEQIRPGTASRRAVLQAGFLSCAGLSLPALLERQALASSDSSRRSKSVILIWLRGGASHIDSFDMKPDAPAEIRGEFAPINTNVPGIQLCEYLPLMAGMMDKLAIIRGIKSNDLGDHTPHYILTGSPDRGKRPAFGGVVSHLQPCTDGLPPYVSLMYEPPKLYDNEGPVYLGPAHRPFSPRREGLENLSLAKGMSLDRLQDRQQLLRKFDTLNRSVANQSALDIHARRALEMVASTKVRDAFDLKQESQATYDRYGKYCENFLLARRIVEAGVPVVTLRVGDWDTHEHNFRDMRDQLPQLDRGFHTLVSDLHDRGLEKDVAVVLWGEFGRAPRISRIAGRDHWPEAGAAVIAGGGFKTGQAIGATDKHGGQAQGRPYTPGNVLANLYHHLGLDPRTTIADQNQRPIPLLDDPTPVQELIS